MLILYYQGALATCLIPGSGSRQSRDLPVDGKKLVIRRPIKNKTGLQPVSRPVEQVHYFGGWLEGAKSLCAKTLLADGRGGARCTVLEEFFCVLGKTQHEVK